MPLRTPDETNRMKTAFAATMIVAALLSASTARAAGESRAGLTVLTYNVEGLPFPLRLGRDAGAAEIATRLRQLRAGGRQPRVVVFQEAFTAAAKAVAVKGGYRYIADGPGRDDAGAPARDPADRAFAAGASLLRGERSGKWADSGLRVASDFPILSVRRMPFPAYACAGFDCLANKGALAVMVRLPGTGQPVAIVATHLNSRAAAHVPFARSLYAYRRQVDALGRFVRAVVPPSMPMVLAGDFNAGQRPDRRGYLIRNAALWHGAAAPNVAMDDCLTRTTCGKEDAADIRFSFHRGRDWQFFAPGKSVGLNLVGLSVPFGHNRDGSMLSDHVGYVATYHVASRIMPRVTPLEIAAR